MATWNTDELNRIGATEEVRTPPVHPTARCASVRLVIEERNVPRRRVDRSQSGKRVARLRKRFAFPKRKHLGRSYTEDECATAGHVAERVTVHLEGPIEL